MSLAKKLCTEAILGFGLLFLLLGGIGPLSSPLSGTHAQLTFARVDSLTDALKYLVQFGYLKNLNEVASLLQPSFTSFDFRNPAVSAMRLAFSKFQQYAKLPVTGEFDATTKKKMNSPRCGNKDILQIDASTTLNGLVPLQRKRRFVAGAFQWQKRELSYSVTKFSDTDFSPEVTLREVDIAFELWGNVTNLHFVRSQGTGGVDIELKFAKGVHGDVEPFDGRGITLAHAFPPGPAVGGDIHFDDDEQWTSGVLQGTNFLHVVVHELGHALGLRHSDIEEAIMYAFARSYEPDLQLHEDDIEGIQSMYGPREGGGETSTMQNVRTSTSSTTSTSATTPEPEVTSTISTTPKGPNVGGEKPDLCKDSKIDAITTLGDGSVYAFKGNYAFRLDPNGGGVQNSDEISYIFYSAEGPLDAAMTYEGKTFLFKGAKYWRFVNRKLDGTNFPRKISNDFPGIPDNLDAAFTWSGDNHIYFFKGDKYWAFNPTESPPVGGNYPLPLSQWYGLPTKDLDAVFTAPSGPTYFFQGDNYWLFDDDNFQVAETEPPYPQSSRVMWFKCTPYRPEAGELRRGFLRKTVDAVASVVKGVTGLVGYKVKKLTGWLG